MSCPDAITAALYVMPQTQDIHPVLVQCWASVHDAGPTLNKRRVNILCLLHKQLRLSAGILLRKVTARIEMAWIQLNIAGHKGLRVPDVRVAWLSGFLAIPAKTRHLPSVALMLGRRRRQRASVKTTLGQHHVFEANSQRRLSSIFWVAIEYEVIIITDYIRVFT